VEKRKEVDTEKLNGKILYLIYNYFVLKGYLYYKKRAEHISETLGRPPTPLLTTNSGFEPFF
jgi:hypothetical protein